MCARVCALFIYQGRVQNDLSAAELGLQMLRYKGHVFVDVDGSLGAERVRF